MTQIRNMPFTWNNYPENWRDHLCDLKNVEWLLAADEVAASGTPHIQGFVRWTNRGKTFAGAQKAIPGCHFLEMHGTFQHQRDYICGPYEKDGKVKPARDDYIEIGTQPEQGKRNDLIAFKKAIKEKRPRTELADEHTMVMAKYPKFEHTLREIYMEDEAHRRYEEGKSPEVIVHWGETRTGKSRLVWEGRNRDVFKIRAEKKQWFDGYTHQKILLIEEFRGQMDVSFFLDITDRYPVHVEIKGGWTWLCIDTIYICTNMDPDDWYIGEDARTREAVKRRLTKIEKFE